MNAILMMIAVFLFMKSSWLGASLLILGVVVFFVVNLIVRQEGMLYVPCVMAGMQTPDNNPDGYKSPAERGMEYEDVHMQTADKLSIHAWFISAGEKASEAPTILFCHANAGNIGLRVPNFTQIVEKLGANIFAFDYRGYGHSEGQPSEEGLIEDALTSWQWLSSAAADGRIDGSRVFIFGRSLGGAVSIALASELLKRGEKMLPQGIILENTFVSISALVDSLFPIVAFKSLKDRFLRLRWYSIDRIPDVEVPFLFISGQKDELIPTWHMEALRKGAEKSPLRRMLAVANGTHNDTWEKGGQAYWDAQAAFIKECGALSARGKPNPEPEDTEH
mmetsp:Transcript_50713/g.91477  ORF Transcript_50713/g.91477 Transcript_50713/m.91477 type:complete len:334 (-) Transcript_50713:30-1031(-)